MRTVKQVLWPDHCVVNTEEMNLAPDLAFNSSRDKLIYKGLNPVVKEDH